MGKYAEDVALLDVCPFSLGIGTINSENYDKDIMSIVIPKGTKLPCKKKKFLYLR